MQNKVVIGGRTEAPTQPLGLKFIGRISEQTEGCGFDSHQVHL